MEMVCLVRRFYGERFFTLSQDLLCAVDRAGRFTATNPAWQVTLGWSAGVLDAMSYGDLIHPDDLVVTETAHAYALNGEQVADFVNRCRCTDGTYRWILWTASTDPSTDVTFAIGKDVSKRREDALRLTGLASIVNSSDDAIVSKDLDLNITTWNHGAERMYGYTEAEMLGHSISLLVPHDREGEAGTILGWVVAGEALDHFETERLRKDGTRLQVSVSTSVVRDLDGRIIGASSIARDTSASHALAGAQHQVMNRLLLAATFRDNATGQHISRMAALCGEIAGVLGWNPQRISDITAAAAMHDVGKIAIPDSILLKPGSLSAQQWTVTADPCRDRPSDAQRNRNLSHRRGCRDRAHPPRALRRRRLPSPPDGRGDPDIGPYRRRGRRV